MKYMRAMIKCCSFWERWSPYLLSLLRVVAAGMILQHGGQKIIGYPSPEHHIIYRPYSWPAGISGSIELLFGLLLLVGLLTRLAAFILSGEMAVAYCMVHAHLALWPIHNGGELAVIFCFVFLYLSAAGGGPLSLDRLFFRRPEEDDGGEEALVEEEAEPQ